MKRGENFLKKITLFLSIFLLPIGLSCDSNTWSDIFKLKSVKSSKGQDIEELKKEISEYETQIDEKIKAGNKLGITYQKLGEKYLERKAWDLAIDSFEKAIGNGQHNPITFYSLGLSHANKSKDIPDKKSIKKAEYYYKKALKLEPDYPNARYGLAILLFYVKGEKNDGLKMMQNLVYRNKNYYNARFGLARFHYELGNLHKSLSVYEDLYADLSKAADSSTNTEYKNNCKINIERLMKEIARNK